jgi:alkanesulfonate monooxygenase SsuD/methylene tetrahydromethanopterin reductase-like flavin-dependent oxidoreductase (luciferase family)
MLGAMAAVTHRARLGCLLTSMARTPNSQLGPAVAAMQKLSRGRLVVGLPSQSDQQSYVTALHAGKALNSGVRAYRQPP